MTMQSLKNLYQLYAGRLHIYVLYDAHTHLCIAHTTQLFAKFLHDTFEGGMAQNLINREGDTRKD